MRKPTFRCSYLTALIATCVAIAGASAQGQCDEAAVRRILLDITLGGTYGYFKAHAGERNPEEAVRRWDAGVRVANAGRFERREVGGSGNWRHTYRGSAQQVDPMDIALTSDLPRARPPRVCHDEAHVRLILLDITLGQTYAYFKRHDDETDPREAIRRWDAGVRVANASRFDRKELGSPGSWRHTYRVTSREADGVDVVLTSDSRAR